MTPINAIIMKIFSIIEFCYRFSNLSKLFLGGVRERERGSALCFLHSPFSLFLSMIYGLCALSLSCCASATHLSLVFLRLPLPQLLLTVCVNIRPSRRPSRILDLNGPLAWAFSSMKLDISIICRRADRRKDTALNTHTHTHTHRYHTEVFEDETCSHFESQYLVLHDVSFGQRRERGRRSEGSEGSAGVIC